MELARIASLVFPVFVAFPQLITPVSGQEPPLPIEHPMKVDLDALRGLCDDAIPGNCSTSYKFLLARGVKACTTLRWGLASDDWQQRLLSAVLFTRLQPRGDDLELVSRILIGHLADNNFRGDSRLAEIAIVALGEPIRPYLRAAAWNAEGQLATKCSLVYISTSSHRPNSANAANALETLRVDVEWIGEGEPSPPALSPAIPTTSERVVQLFAALAGDQRKGNANEAYYDFRVVHFANRDTERPGHWGPTQTRPPRDEELKLPLIWSGLRSEDRQQRQLCAMLLVERMVSPSDLLMEVLVEALEQDELGSYRTLPLANADRSGQFLIANTKQASAHLHLALESKSQSVRIRAAAILAQGRDPKVSAYAPLLVEHLANNSIPDDAVLCGQSLALLGPLALPWLEATPKDEQQAHFFEVIRRSIQMLEEDPKARLPFSQGGMYALAR